MVTDEQVRLLLSTHGSVRSQPAADWQGSIPLPTFVKRYYREVGPADITIANYGNPFFLPSLSGLWAIQVGYRWDRLTGERIADWKDDWLVVGHDCDGAFVTSLGAEQVSYAVHGTGVWDPKFLFPDMATMVACLAVPGLIVSEAGEDFTDDECLIRPQYLADAVAQVAEMVGSPTAAKVVLSTLAWM